MSAYADYRREFFDDITRNSWKQPSELETKWNVLLPEHIQRRWLRKFWEPASTRIPGLHANHFLIGADPEFYFWDPSAGRMDANSLGLKAGLAFGADNNGRLAELRPAPSRSTLEVTASIAAELRWLSWCKPELSRFEWRCAAHNGHDGLGGHIHFGRKRSTREQEARALDTLAFWLYHAGIFDQTAGRTRVQRTRGHGNYGALTDVRPQAHGWEYRTLPSWIDSPWLAFFTLTLSKLVVYNPDLLPRLNRALELESASRVRSHLSALLAYYQHRDSDAALAYAILQTRDFPRWDATDFRPRWGLFAVPPGLAKPQVIPGHIYAHSDEVSELASALLAGRAPDPVHTEPTWQPSKLPEGYVYLPDRTETFHAPGLGELVVGLASHSAASFQLVSPANSRAGIWLGAYWYKRLGGVDYVKKLQAKFPGYSIEATSGDPSGGIFISTAVNWKEDSGKFREWLLGGDFPVWRVGDLKTGDYEAWQDSSRTTRAPKIFSRQL